MKNNYLLEEGTIKEAFLPVDLNTAPVVGARIGMAKTGRVAIAITMGTSVAALVQFTFKQHNAATGGTSKVVAIANTYYVKAGAATSFTKVEPTVAASMVDLSTDFATNGGTVVFEILAEDLDVDGNFSHISVELADTAAAKLGSGLYIVDDCKFKPAYSEVV